jgi:hypothetical protein
MECDLDEGVDGKLEDGVSACACLRSSVAEPDAGAGRKTPNPAIAKNLSKVLNKFVTTTS